ncbi:MAG: hypothetical protein H7Z19_19845 [Chitinophagaceae bacterium]|nr:hypothetical protein [Rubrivivax sp.]
MRSGPRRAACAYPSRCEPEGWRRGHPAWCCVRNRLRGHRHALGSGLGRPRVRVSIHCAIHIQADEGLLRSLLTNLIGNAWKFTAKENDAHIEVGCDDAHEGWVVHFVRDNGAGFAMNEAAKVFEPFHRFHSEGDFAGIGVGLATCQRIVHRHGGSIWMNSAPGKGATVYFSLSRTEVKGHPPCVPIDSFFATFG